MREHIHALRIYYAINNLPDIEERVIAGNLQKIFNKFLRDATEAEVKNFLKVLWQVRYQFDTWCVKWLEGEDSSGEELALTSVTRQKKKGVKKVYLNRNRKEHSAIELLQSVRIFTGERSAQYWLTPFLTRLILEEYTLKDEEEVLQVLEQSDNELSLATQTQKELSFKLALDEDRFLKPWEMQKVYLEEQHGTSFEHYWFQKLEYVIWRNHKRRSDPKFKRYRITAKNSVEHVHPQHERYGSKIDELYLHAFGNLVLLSPGQNSEYSNKAVLVKYAEFQKKPTYDSLKLKYLFDELERAGKKNLSKQIILQHQQQMIALLQAHYGA